MTNLFEALGAALESATNHYANEHSQNLALAIYPYVYGGLMLWFTVMSFQVLSGRLQQPFINLVERLGAGMVLASIAFGPSVYQVEILNDFDSLQNALVSAVAGTETSPYKAADVALQRGFDIGGQFSEQTTVSGPESFVGWIIGACVIFFGSAFISLSAAGSIMVAKASLSLILAWGQIAIACAIFPATRKMFEAWISTVLNRVLTILFVTMAMSFCLSLFSGIAGGYDPVNSEPLSFAAELLIAVVVCVGLMRGASTIASELAGGVALAVANPITAAAKLATQPLASAANYLSGKSSRTNAQTGQQEYASRASHIAKGNTMLNPAYRQKALANMKSGWGASSGGSAKSSSSAKSPTEKLMAMHQAREQQSKK
jgi:type IV secretion system protein VirB6